MIGYLKGTLIGTQKNSSSRVTLTLEVNQVGYDLQIVPRLVQQLPAMGELFQVFTHLQIRDDQITLFGFASAAELSPSDVRVSGFVSSLYGLNNQVADPETALENAYWTIAQDANTEESYKAYLDKYPRGENAAEALSRIKTIQDGIHING